MKRCLPIYILLLLLAACDDTIEYKGAQDPAQLVVTAEVVAGEPVACYISRTRFFLDAQAMDTVYKYSYFYDDRGNIVDSTCYADLTRRPDYVGDAQVRMRVNTGEWFALTYDTDAHCYTSPNRLAAGDVVKIEATHADYGTATATQSVPQPPVVQLIDQQITPYGTLEITLQVASYTGDQSSVIGISIPHGRMIYSMDGLYTDDGEEEYPTDDDITEQVQDTVSFNLLYSEDALFGELKNQQTASYYGVRDNAPLYFPASSLTESRQIKLLLQYYDRGISFDAVDLHTDSLCVRVAAYTEDQYLYRQSIADSFSYLPPPIGLPYDPNDDFLLDMDEMLGGLGGQEEVQVYTNIRGGIGHFSVAAATDVDILLSQEQLPDN